MNFQSIKITRNALGRALSGWLSNYKLIHDIWRERFPQDDQRESLSTLEKTVMTLLLIIRGFSFVNMHHFFTNDKVRSEVSELYVVTWLSVLLVLLWHPITCLPLLYALVIYRLIDGMNYRLCIIFVDRYAPEWGLRSLNRSLILLMLNYFEIIVSYAILFLHTRSIGTPIPNLYLVSSPLESLYFSLMTIITLSLGDLQPLTPTGKVLAISEPFLGMLLIVLVVGTFLTGVKGIREKSPSAGF